MTSWPDGKPVTPWADPWHDILGDIRALHDSSQAAYRPPPGRWVGYCAPGRTALAWLQVASDPAVNVTAIEETAGMAGRTDIILVNLDEIPEDLLKILHPDA